MPAVGKANRKLDAVSPSSHFDHKVAKLKFTVKPTKLFLKMIGHSVKAVDITNGHRAHVSGVHPLKGLLIK